MPVNSAAGPLPAIAGALLLCGGAWVMYQEAAPNLRGGNSPLSRNAALAADPGPVGISLLTQRSALLDCEQAMRSAQSLEIRYSADTAMRETMATCGQVAGSIAAHNPATSLAWIVAAQVSIAGQDIAGFNQDMARSRAVAPNELWLARMRVNLGELNIAAMDDDQQAGHLRDIAVVAADDTQVVDMARHYLAHADFRDRMEQALELMQPLDQRVFLSIVQTYLGQGR